MILYYFGMVSVVLSLKDFLENHTTFWGVIRLSDRI